MTNEIEVVAGDIKAEAVVLWDDVEGSKAATIVKNAYNAAITELKTFGVQQVETAVVTITEAVLPDLADDNVEGAIEAGVAAAVPAFETAEKAITATTASTLVTSVVQQVQALGTTATVTPAA